MNRLRGLLERVLNWAATREFRNKNIANPARWKGHLSEVLKKPNKVKRKKHFAAMPYNAIPGLVQELLQRDTIAAETLLFVLLTGCRVSMATNATWGKAIWSEDEIEYEVDEVDLTKAVWTIPAERMKNRKPFRIPLSPDALAILKALKARSHGSHYIFTKDGSPLSRNTPRTLLVLLGYGGRATTHGMRASLRSWAADNGISREVAEMALAHTIADETEASYQHSDLYARRAKMMQAWADHCFGRIPTDVPMITKRRAMG
jgi:integrase